MKFPLEWLAEFAPLSTTPEDLASRLTRAGMVVDAVEGSGDETVFEIDVPTNRPDAMNIHGIAREIAAATGGTLKAYPLGVAEQGDTPASQLTSVSILDGDLCGRYCARVIRGVSVGPSPDWMVQRLRRAGLNVLYNIVDVTNYVLWEYGHPLHAFDLDRLAERRILVRRAAEGEKLTTLDGVLRTLGPEMLVIADASRAVALAGIMGGSETMISGQTADVLLESAWFQPVSVRRTAKALGISTDASYRFERGTDMEAAHVAIDRAASLIAEVAGGRVAPGLIDERAMPMPPRRRLRLRLGRVRRLIGMEVSPQDARGALEFLGFSASPSTDAGEEVLDVTVPASRQDVHGEADLVEEVGRIVGYEELPEEDLTLPGYGAIHRFAHRREDEWRASLLASGFTEVLSIPFVDEARDSLGRQEGRSPLRLTNPMAEGQEILRTGLLPGLAHALRRNQNHGVKDVRIFEVGRVFHRSGEQGREDRSATPGVSGQPGIREPLTCGMAATGMARSRHWSDPARESTLHDLKGALEEALDRVRIRAEFTRMDDPPFRTGTGLGILLGDRPVGRMGEVTPAAASALDVKGGFLFAELDLTALFAAPASPPLFTPLDRYPAVTRDLALVVPHGVLWADIEAAIREAGGELVSDVSVFDRYTGGNLPEGHVSLAVSIVFKRPDRTLEAEEAQEAERQVLDALGGRLGITLRT